MNYIPKTLTFYLHCTSLARVHVHVVSALTQINQSKTPMKMMVVMIVNLI